MITLKKYIPTKFFEFCYEGRLHTSKGQYHIFSTEFHNQYLLLTGSFADFAIPGYKYRVCYTNCWCVHSLNGQTAGRYYSIQNIKLYDLLIPKQIMDKLLHHDSTMYGRFNMEIEDVVINSNNVQESLRDRWWHNAKQFMIIPIIVILLPVLLCLELFDRIKRWFI